MSAAAKEKVAIEARSEQWPMVIDARSIGILKSDSEVQYLVIPVKNKSGRKIHSRLPDESNLEEKVQAFLQSVGLANTFAWMKVKKSRQHIYSEKDDGFDIFDGLEGYRDENNKRVANFKEYILADSEWINANELSDLVGFENKNRSAGPNTWKRRNKIFAISHKGKNLYPRYCLDDGYQPVAVIKNILDLFDNSKSGWSLAFWFGTANSWLDGAKPKDVLTGDKSRLLRAVQAAIDGIQHG